MATPVQTARRGGHRTPASGRHTAIKRTPQSALTPNDDAAERASVRRQKRSAELRKSLSDAFGDSSDQQQGRTKPTLPREALEMLFNNCLKLAAENKINDKNVWQLSLIEHLPSIISTGTFSSSSGFNFQKVSGGLDAGVTIYSKRVDTTYKEAFQTLQMGVGTSKGEDGDVDDEGGEGCEDDAIEDAAAAAAKQAKQGAAAKRRKQDTASEEATLATAEQLKERKVDNTFAVDPMFHKMSALFDEGGAKGLLLLNRSVYKGANIMTDPHAVPEEQFPLAAAAEPDTLINMQHLHQQLAACHAASSTGASVLTPGLGQMYALLEQVVKKVPGQQEQKQRVAVDVAAVMAKATRGLPATAMPAQSSAAPTAAAAATGAAGSGAHDMAAGDDYMHCDEDCDSYATAADGAADADAYMASVGVAAGSAAVAAFLADAAMAGPDDDAAAAGGGSWGDEGGCADGLSDDEGAGHAGLEDDGHWEATQQARRQSGMMGLAGDVQADAVLDAEALEQLLGGGRSATTAGGGWAGSSYWKYKSAAAAIARLGGGTTAATKRAAAGSGKSRASQGRIDFENLPEMSKEALAHGTRKQTCLVTAATAAPTLLPQDLHYQASSLGQLFLKPATIRCIRQHVNSSSRGTAGFADMQHEDAAGSWGDDDDDDAAGEGDWGGTVYSDDGGDGADGYNAGDLSMGDPGYSAAAQGGGDSAAADWWASDNELLSAPKRTTGLGVNYNRSAKQVDVRALKDLLWDSLTTVNATAASSSMHADDDAAEGATDSDSAAPTIPFQDVIVSVPEESAAGSIQDVSVHMCFICLLHLANEKGLVIRAKDDLKTLTISNVNA